MNETIEKNSHLPRYFQLKNILVGRIRKMMVGERIPSVQQLRNEFGVSQYTVEKAFSELSREGVIRCEIGNGTFVSDPITSREKSGVLGVIISDVINYFHSQIVRAIEDVGKGRGYHVILCNSDDDPGKEASYIEELEAKRVDGFIIDPVTGNLELGYKHTRALVKRKTPLVFIDKYYRKLKVSYVVTDNFEGAYNITKHLIGLGYKRIAHISEPECSSIVDRESGYKKALVDSGLTVDERLIKRDNLLYESAGYRLIEELLKMGKEKPEAVFCANDRVAKGTLDKLRELRVAVPDDIAVTGYDDLAFVSSLNPPLTTMHQPRYRMGEVATRLLIEKIQKGTEAGIQNVVLKSQLVVRESCGAGKKTATVAQSMK